MIATFLQDNSHITPELIQAARRNDNAAWTILYEQHAKTLFNACLRIMGNKEEAEDIIHDCFLIAQKKLGQLKKPEYFYPWLRRIVINESIKKIRRRVRKVDIDDEEIPYPETEQDENYFEGLSFDTINKEIMKLPEGYRQIFCLYIFEDYAHKEIAEFLKITESTSKSQYHRAKKMLRAELLKHM